MAGVVADRIYRRVVAMAAIIRHAEWEHGNSVQGMAAIGVGWALVRHYGTMSNWLRAVKMDCWTTSRLCSLYVELARHIASIESKSMFTAAGVLSRPG